MVLIPQAASATRVGYLNFIQMLLAFPTIPVAYAVLPFTSVSKVETPFPGSTLWTLVLH